MSLDLASNLWSLLALDGPPHLRDRPIPARIPGCVHLDLLRADLIPDPARDLNELDLQWIGHTRWRYECRLTAPDPLPHAPLDLVFERLDTIARVTLNDTHLGDAANAHHPHRFDIRSVLRTGTNHLAVEFTPPLLHIRDEERRLGARPVNGDWDPFIFLRKPASNLGWDWGPKLATVGISGPVRLEAWQHARIASVRPLILAADAEHADVAVHIDLEWDDATPLHVCASLFDPDGHLAASADDTAALHSQPLLHLHIDRPHLWWPRSHGSQPLYTLRVELDGPSRATGFAASATPVPFTSRRASVAQPSRLCEHSTRLGLRTITLDTSPDRHGSRFRFLVNGKPIFAKGANWIPEGLFPGLADHATVRQRLRQATDANMNMLRVWGGGLYESDDFYNACDELGILVWQDFAFACAMYPEEPPYPALIEREARHNIARLASHPCLALWCGGNECVWGHKSWGWKERLAPRQSWGSHYYFDLLPRLLAELDPTRPYWPNSPWSGARSHHPNDPRHGDRHTWDTSLPHARSFIPRFASEFGHQSPPTFATLAAALSNPERDLRIDSSTLHHRQRATGGTTRHIDTPIADFFRTPTSFDDWLSLAHLLKARALWTQLTWLRVHRGLCDGALLWQLNDCWPGMSWSLIDSAGRPKPAYFAVRRALATRLLAFHPVGTRTVLFADNDTDDPWNDAVRVRYLDATGTTRLERSLALSLSPRSAAALADLTPSTALRSLDLSSASTPIIDASCAQARDTFFPDAPLLPPDFHASLDRDSNLFRLTFTARSIIRDLTLAVDRLDPDATVSDQLLTLLPGESRTITITSARSLALADLTSSPVLACANLHTRRSLLQPLRP
ncbi:MAG: glycosyl hydrolase 2 galactose-binding domain-containing protein [Phycisphaerales bacterium]